MTVEEGCAYRIVGNFIGVTGIVTVLRVPGPQVLGTMPVNIAQQDRSECCPAGSRTASEYDDTLQSRVYPR